MYVMFSNTLKRHRQQTRMNFPLNAFTYGGVEKGQRNCWLLSPASCVLSG